MKTRIKVNAEITVVMLSMSIVLLSGCSAFKTLWPGGVTAADAEWAGSKSMQVIPVSSLLDPQASTAISVVTLLSGKPDPFGNLLAVTPIGETAPRWVFCNTKLSKKCATIPLNARVKFAGSPVILPKAFRSGLLKLFPLMAEDMSKELWIAKDLSASDFDD